MSLLIHNSYGKSRVRLTKVTRHADRHDLKEVTIDLELQGDFSGSYVEGDNALIVATDTMKNTVYALARNHPLLDLEGFGLHLGRHFVERFEQVASATVRLTEHGWDRLSVEGVPAPAAFMGNGTDRRICVVVHDRLGATIESGLEDLSLLKTTDSSFSGFARDAFTTLPDTDERILATAVSARWRYDTTEGDWNAWHQAIRGAMLEVFARHQSPSVQKTLYLMGAAALAACDAVSQVTLHLPNRHRILVNLQPFGLDNPNEIFVATDEPFGTISGTLRRGPE